MLVTTYHKCGHIAQVEESQALVVELTECEFCKAQQQYRAQKKANPKRVERELGRKNQPQGGKRPKIVEVVME